MERDFSSLSNPAFDMLVIGGGATGAAIAWDATLRGLRVAIIDKSDFSAATSAASSDAAAPAIVKQEPGAATATSPAPATAGAAAGAVDPLETLPAPGASPAVAGEGVEAEEEGAGEEEGGRQGDEMAAAATR